MIISEIIPFNVPFKNHNRGGGVKTPPYERFDKLHFIEHKNAFSAAVCKLRRSFYMTVIIL